MIVSFGIVTSSSSELSDRVWQVKELVVVVVKVVFVAVVEVVVVVVVVVIIEE